MRSIIITSEEGGFHLDVAEDGQLILNNWSRKYLKPITDRSGYKRVWATATDGRRRSFLVHRLVAMAWLDFREEHESLDVNHKDGDKANNRFSNLEWVTKAENQRHAYRSGLFRKKKSLLDEERRQKAISLRKKGMLQREIAEELKINQSSVSAILRGYGRR